MFAAPLRHLLAQIILDTFGEHLEKRAGGAPATGAGDHHRGKGTQPHGLQNFLRNDDFPCAVTAGLRRQRDTNRVADAFLQQHAHRRRRSDYALAAHTGLGQTQVQRVITFHRKIAIYRDQILHATDLAGEHDFIMREPHFFSQRGAVDGGRHQRTTRDHRRFFGYGLFRVVIHHAHDQLGIEAAPVDADAHRLVVTAGELDHGGKLFVALRTAPDIARINTQLGQRLSARRMLCQQAVAVEMKITHQRCVHTHRGELVAYMRHGRGGLGGVNGHTHNLGTCACQRCGLGHCASDIGRIGVGHRLHHDRRAATNGNLTHAHTSTRATRGRAITGKTVHQINSFKNKYLYYSRRRRATSSLAYDARSMALPLKLSRTLEDPPTTTLSGGTPVTRFSVPA